MSTSRPFAIVTGASTGIGLELAKRRAKEGYDLLIAADEPEIEQAAASLRAGGTQVEPLRADLATIDGVDKLYAAAKSRPVDALLANAGRGLGHAFLDQDYGKARRVVDTNITGTSRTRSLDDHRMNFTPSKGPRRQTTSHCRRSD